MKNVLIALCFLIFGTVQAQEYKTHKVQEGETLEQIAKQPDDPNRTIFSEYHDGGSSTGAFMVRWDDWKYIYYAGLAPQLFNLAADPRELMELAQIKNDPRVSAALAEGQRRLLEICDPEAVNRQAFADQAKRIEMLGGVEACKTSYLFNHTPTPSEQAKLERSL